MYLQTLLIFFCLKEIDNPPDLSAAVDLMDHDSGDGIDLQVVLIYR